MLHEKGGLDLLNVHAGEHCMQACCPDGAEVDETIMAQYAGPEYVRAALALPGIRRIGHGIESVRDATLMAQLAERGVCLEVCPISNRRLGYCEDGIACHPLPTLLAAGVPCCLAADDPAFFGSRSAHGLHREYVAARHLMGLSDEQLAACARASFTYASCSGALRAKSIAAIDEWLRAEPGLGAAPLATEVSLACLYLCKARPSLSHPRPRVVCPPRDWGLCHRVSGCRTVWPTLLSCSATWACRRRATPLWCSANEATERC